MPLKIVIAADHAGFELKNELVARLKDRYDLQDLGAYTYDSTDDYPDFALAVALKVKSGEVERGIVVCGSGVGAGIVANKVPGIMASVCHDIYSAHQGVEHDNMNVLCLGARVIGVEVAVEIATVFLQAKYNDIPKHARRLRKISEIERRFFREST